MVSQKVKQAILAMETPYDKAMRLKLKLAKSKTHSLSIKRANSLKIDPNLMIKLYPRSFKIENGNIMFNTVVVSNPQLLTPLSF